MHSCESPAVQAYCKLWDSLQLQNDILCHVQGNLVQRVVPAQWQLILFQRIHTHECMHLGCDRVYAMVQKHYFWPRMSVDIQEWTQSCLNCQKAKLGRGKGKLPLQQDRENVPMGRVAMDIAGPFPISKMGIDGSW